MVLFIAIGLFLFTYQSTQFNLTGFALVLSASFLSGLRWTLAQLVLQKKETGKLTEKHYSSASCKFNALKVVTFVVFGICIIFYI